MTGSQLYRSGLFYFLFYAVLTNIPYWIASELFAFQPRGWFCLEYPLAGIVSLGLPSLARGSLLVLLFWADFECGIYDSYYLTVRQCLENSNVFLNSISSARHDIGVLVALLLLAIVATATSRMPAQLLSREDRATVAMSLLAFSTLAASLETAGVVLERGALPNLRHLSLGTDTIEPAAFAVARIARAPIYQLIRRELAEAGVRADRRKNGVPAASVPSATAFTVRAENLLRADRVEQLPDVVLILVESWGLAEDARLNQAVLEPYKSLQGLAKYEVVQGTVPFHGGTIAGESRELCGSTRDFSLLLASRTELEDCIPHRLAALGYRDIAVHGMSGHMFARSDWYPIIGFQESWFYDQLKEQGLPECAGAFVGTCDSAIAGWIGRRLEERNRRPFFIHWVTLNSHLPLPVPAPLTDGPSCLQSSLILREPAMCSWYRLVTGVHRSVARIASETLDRPAVFVIVGDHAPPFSDPILHGSFSQSLVPYLLLLPRSGPRRDSGAVATGSSVESSGKQPRSSSMGHGRREVTKQ